MKRIEDLIVYLTADYSQIEIRLLAQASGDKLLIKQFNSKEDIHCLVGNSLTGWSVEKIAADKETRRGVKEFHFSIVYGTSKNSLYGNMRVKGVKIKRSQVETWHDRYFEKYIGVARFMAKCRRQAEEKGYVETMFGFRRYIYQREEGRPTFWGNQAVNTPIQGSAHQLLLIALALVDMKPKTYNLLQVPVMEVHDELVFYVRLGDLRAAYESLRQLMEKDVVAYAEKHFGVKLCIPILAEFKAGFRLGKALVTYEGESVAEFLKAWRIQNAEVTSMPLSKLLPK
jgi:DNA polymerase-1